MKYTYAYKTSDGSRHEATMVAESREAVFAALREKGIKAIKVVAADGSKANGEIRGVRKRMVAVLLFVVALAVGVAAYLTGSQTVVGTSVDSAKVSARHQIYGDPAIMESFERGEFDRVLLRGGDKMLAWFAEPGRLMCPQGIDVRRLTPKQLSDFAAYAESELTGEKDLEVVSDELREYRELKQIVNGMRKEMRAYLANGNGTVKSYWRRLIQRTSEEMQMFERTRRELENEKNPQVWEKKNSALRQIGLRTIPNKKETED